MADNTSGNQGNRENTPKQSGLSWSQPASMAKPVQTGASTQKPSPLLKPATPAPAQSKNNNGSSGRRTFMLFAGGIVVGGLLAWSWFSVMPEGSTLDDVGAPAAGDTSMSGEGEQKENGGTALPGSSLGSEALVVPSPQAAGLSVVVTNATVSAPTWVVVYETNNGVRGNALGAALFFPEGGDKTINLLRATVPNRTYFLGRHIDNGDKQFSMTLDKPVTNATGNPVYMEFRTQ